jgi:hypothetical protein
MSDSGIAKLNLVRLSGDFRILLFPVPSNLWWRGFQQNLRIIRAGKTFFWESCLRRNPAESIQKSFSGTNNGILLKSPEPYNGGTGKRNFLCNLHSRMSENTADFIINPN